MLAGMFPLIRDGQTGPGIVGRVWQALQKPNPWPALLEIGLSEPIDESPGIDPELNAWWADVGHEIRKDGYSLLAAHFLASVEGVRHIFLSFNLFRTITFLHFHLIRVEVTCSRNGSLVRQRCLIRHPGCQIWLLSRLVPTMRMTGQSARKLGNSC